MLTQIVAQASEKDGKLVFLVFFRAPVDSTQLNRGTSE